MKQEIPPPVADTAGEISALIGTLHQAGQRLEELTAGEVDTVSDQDGRIFQLRHSQEQSRRSSADRQAAVLNSLPANIALLDAQGVILSVNEAWRRFSGANGAHFPGHGIGIDYLEICDSASGDHSSEARQAAAGIRSVLDGTTQSFSIEYPCHSPSEQRWFLMTATPLSGENRNGAVVMHMDITDRMKAEHRIRRLNRVYAVLSGINTLIVRVSDREELFREACRIAVEHGGFRMAWIGIVDRTRMELRPVASAGTTQDFRALVNQNFLLLEGAPRGNSLAARSIREKTPIFSNDVLNDPLIVFKDEHAARGSRSMVSLPLQVSGEVAGLLMLYSEETDFFDDEEMKLLTALAGDIAFAVDHIERARKLVHITRVNAVMSGINALIVRARDRDELFKEACRIAVEQGQFKMAWIGVVNRSAMKIEPVASAGSKTEYLAYIKDRFSLVDEPSVGLTMTARAVREKKALFSNDTQNDPGIKFKKEHVESGTRSLASIPLLVLDEVVGVICLYTEEADFFDAEEMKLLVELASNIAFAIDHIEKAEKLARMTRVNAMLSGINGAIVRIRDRQELFEEACRIAVETGALPFAWIGVVDASGTQLQLLASAGRDDGFLQTIRDRLAVRDDAPEAQSLSVRAIRERRAVVANDLTADAVLSRRQAFADRGIKSVAIFPLFIASRVVGAFALHSEHVGFFDADEMTLLNEVAANIAFALEHIEKEEKVRRLTRVYAVLSGINTLIVRARDRDGLFKEACRIAVEAGHFLKAWLGIIDSGSKQFRMVAAHGGDPAFFQDLEKGLNKQILSGHGLVFQAIATRHPVISNDARSDAEVLLKDAAVASGVRSIAVLPLIVAGEAVGVLTLNADTPGYFDDQEMKLLVELAGDIAFAIDHIGKQDQLKYLAYYDELTGLANRSLLLERVAQYMRSAVSGGHKLALFVLDLERFRNINDSLGRPAGDALLKQVADLLSRGLRDPNLLARLGADQFAVVLPELAAGGNVEHLLEKRIRLFLENPFRVNDTEIRIGVKVGIAVFPKDGIDATTLLRNAEVALKKAKRKGESYLFYKSKMTATVAGKLTLENQLREALNKEEFVLHYQPKVNLDSGKLTSAEALIRWNDPRTGLVPPGRFIPILEETGLIQDVGRWALRKAIGEYLRWRAAGLPAVRIAVNVSPLQLRNRGFVEEIRQVVSVDPHAAEGLELEITESLIMENVEHSIASLKAIRAMGVTIAIDDFGTGFSSLSYLAKLPVDTLKIDRSFVNDMSLSPQGLSLVSTVITLAHSLMLKVVAEGVETEEQSRLLRLLRCDEMQGFLFSKPVPVDIFEGKFLAGTGGT